VKNEMTIEAFKTSLDENNPPEGLDQKLLALWYDAKGDWQKSHAIIQDIESKDAALIHAYLHRKEGDLWNADYWYQRAGSKRPGVSLDEEWNNLLSSFL
jgi:hypothetical protein